MTGRRKDTRVLEVDSRRRISLGSLAQHDRYLVTVEPDGRIVLTPAVVTAVTGAEAIRTSVRSLDHQAGGRERNSRERTARA